MTGGNCPRELKDRAVEMLRETTPDHGSDQAAIEAAAKNWGIGTPETLREWSAAVGGGFRLPDRGRDRAGGTDSLPD
ncbi:MAG: hypothetical protein LBQ06_04875 [Frankiaceae bacterium]|jgi:transposase-like protein|nr:hypothetical protein [Frankiaceae bacterium]